MKDLPMNNIVLVAVVDAGEYLFDQNGSISFAEFSTLKYLIKEFTTFADSN